MVLIQLNLFTSLISYGASGWPGIMLFFVMAMLPKRNLESPLPLPWLNMNALSRLK